MKETKLVTHRFSEEEFLTKLGINGEHVMAIEEVSQNIFKTQTSAGKSKVVGHIEVMLRQNDCLEPTKIEEKQE